MIGKTSLHTSLALACFGLIFRCGISASAVAAEEARQEELSTRQHDVVIYGGTSAGVIAAVQASAMGKSVVLVNHYRHLGGLTSSGLGQTDSGREAVIGGLSRGFYQRVREYYRDEDAWVHEDRADYLGLGRHLRPDDDAQWGFEPRVAERIFHEMLDEAGIPYEPGEFLVRDNGRGVRKEGNRIVAIVTESGNVYRGRMFIDATYEGDLMAEAGVSYIVGREGNEVYGETLNGIQTGRSHNHVFTHEGRREPPRPLPPEARVDPYVVPGDPSTGLLAGVNADAGGDDGEGDHRVQSYCYRLCLTDVRENQVPFDPPPGYDEADFELLFRMFEAGEERIPWLPGRMPNRKTDTNNRWAVSLNLVGGADEYPEAGYERRREIERKHEYWQRGILHSLANHPRVPGHVREEVSRWGYAADEFTDKNHWPYAIYVRVGRRMIGEYVMTEHDCRRIRIAPDPVGMGSYAMDSHNVQRYVTPEGYVQNEGNIEVPPGGAYAISYRSIVPKRGEAENLLVPVAVSSSHIAFGSIRMEPVFMILGQSAATAAVFAIEGNVPVQDVDYAKLRLRLLDDGQILEDPNAVSGIRPESLYGIVIDNTGARMSGAWIASTHTGPFVGLNYLHDQNSDKGNRFVTYRATLPAPGRYEVRLSYSAHANRASNVPVTVHHANGRETVRVNQRQTPPIANAFRSIGTFAFGREAEVVIGNEDTDGYVVADAVQFLRVERQSR